jgi:hypothetical protein
MENNTNHENFSNENSSDKNIIKENNTSDDINQNMKKTSSNNDLEDEGKEADITGQILFRRVMGKKLCSVTLLNEEQNIIIGASIHDPEIIPKLKIGDMINIKGRIYYHRNNPKNKNIQAETVKLLGKGPGADKINEKRKYFIDNKNTLTNYDALCTYIKKGQKCPNKDCKFRHELKKEEEETLKTNMLKKKRAYDDAHEGDPLNIDDKYNKSLRNSEFANFLVDKFGLENIKKGFVLDIAGGKGLVSFFLTTVYGIRCKIIDPRGATLPKSRRKELKKKKIQIEEDRKMFTLDTCDELIKGCSLIIGMHPDEATVDIVDVALAKKINFAVVPCCVFHNKFPDRKLKNGKEVVEYQDLIQFILEKDDKLQTAFLNIKGRNKVIYKIFE